MLPRLLLLALLAPLLPACRSLEGEGPAAAYTLVLLETGPRSGALSKEESSQAFAGHFSNMERLAEARRLLVAGPFGRQKHDAALRGIFVLATADRDEAIAWAETDPAVEAGVFTPEYHDLETRAPLLAALERDLAWRAERAAAGEPPKPGEGGRGYVLLTAEQAELAEPVLEPLGGPGGGVYLLGRLDGTRAFAVLDAASLEEARERFGAALERIGPHVLDEWFASAQLARMAD